MNAVHRGGGEQQKNTNMEANLDKLDRFLTKFDANKIEYGKVFYQLGKVSVQIKTSIFTFLKIIWDRRMVSKKFFHILSPYLKIDFWGQ